MVSATGDKGSFLVLGPSTYSLNQRVSISLNLRANTPLSVLLSYGGRCEPHFLFSRLMSSVFAGNPLSYRSMTVNLIQWKDSSRGVGVLLSSLVPQMGLQLPHTCSVSHRSGHSLAVQFPPGYCCCIFFLLVLMSWYPLPPKLSSTHSFLESGPERKGHLPPFDQVSVLNHM